jgi:hypothetical protein
LIVCKQIYLKVLGILQEEFLPGVYLKAFPSLLFMIIHYCNIA